MEFWRFARNVFRSSRHLACKRKITTLKLHNTPLLIPYTRIKIIQRVNTELLLFILQNRIVASIVRGNRKSPVPVMAGQDSNIANAVKHFRPRKNVVTTCRIAVRKQKVINRRFTLDNAQTVVRFISVGRLFIVIRQTAQQLSPIRRQPSWSTWTIIMH